MSVELYSPPADRAAAWATVDRLSRLEPWCLELDEATGEVFALFAAAPALLDRAWVVRPARAARFGAGWRDAQRATQVGPLWVVSRGRRPPLGARFALEVEALHAFGAGTHETTVLCLERVVEASPVEAVLDVGTGSGILALAALRLGARRAVGLDIDARSLAEARTNAERSGLSERLELSLDPIGSVGRFPLVLANVRTPALIALAPAILGAASEALSLSGVQVGERDEVVAAYAMLGARVVGEAVRGDWMRIDVEPPRDPTPRGRG